MSVGGPDRWDAAPTPRPETLVRGLEDLHRGPAIQLELIAFGPRAIEALAAFLLGPPSQHPQPRMLAAEALCVIGGAGAVDALVRALLAGDLRSLSLELRISEEAVRNTIARELGRLGDRAAIPPLLEALERFHLVEAGRALAALRERRAVPLLVECLGDPFIRTRSAEAIVEFGDTAVDALLDGLARRGVNDDTEARWSVERRQECARLLGEIGNRRAEPRLRRHLHDSEPLVGVAVALAVTRLAPDTAGDDVVALLVEGLRSEDPLVADDHSDALATLGPRVVEPVAAAFAREASQADARGEPALPAVLRVVARTLARLGDRGLVVLGAFTRHPSPLARGVAVATLARADSKRAGEAIAAVLHDPDPRVRRTAQACGDRLRRCPHGH
jgi:HEAT repeat protein